MKTNLLFTSLLVGMSLTAFGQEKSSVVEDRCGSDQSRLMYYKQFPEAEILDQQIEKTLNTPLSPKKAADVYRIPVVVHVVHAGGAENITDDQVITGIQAMTDQYNGLDPEYADVIPEFESIKEIIGIEFELAKLDPQGNPSSGIYHHYDKAFARVFNGGTTDSNMKNKYAWPRNQYLNVYVVRIPDYGQDAGSAWAYSTSNGVLDGVTVAFWSIGGNKLATPTHLKNMTHEVGHYLSLGHTFNGGCNSTDGVADTPPCTQGSGCVLDDEPCGVLANRQNYMDYGTCTSMFTTGQKTKMINYLNTTNGNNRSNLWSASNLAATGLTGIPFRSQFFSEHLTSYPGNSIEFVDYSISENSAITNWEWEFEGGNPATFTGQTPPFVVYDNIGKYDVKLTVTNADSETTVFEKKEYITIQIDQFIQTADFKIDSLTLYDTGFDGKYGNRTDATLTLRPTTVGEVLEVTFKSFDFEINCLSDYLKVYDGPDVSADLIGTFCGNSLPPVIRSSHVSGALTFEQHNNVTTTFEGFEATVKSIELIPATPVAQFMAKSTKACPGVPVSFKDQSEGVPNEWNWVFEGGSPATSNDEDPIVSYTAAGTYTVTLTVKNALGENTEEKVDYITIEDGAIAIPYVQDFEGTFLPQDWVLNNPDNSNTWVKSTLGYSSTSSMVMDNSTYKDKGEYDEVILPKFDFSDVSVASMTFDLAYTMYHVGNADFMGVYVSKDCGNTWDEVYAKFNVGLQTKDIPQAQSNAWKPSSTDDWRNDYINLSAYAGEAYVLIKFKNVNDYGNNVWVDNINISNTLTVGEKEATQFSIYPNPTNGNVTILSSLENSEFKYSILSLNGKEVANGRGFSKTTVDLSNQAKGIYLLKITSKNSIITRKVMIK